MKYLRLFKTQAEFESSEIIKPNVSFIEEIKGLIYIPKEEILEYHFEVPMKKYMGDTMCYWHNGRKNDDYSEIYANIISIIETYGIDGDLRDPELSQRMNITINGHKPILMWLEDDHIYMETDDPDAYDISYCELRPTSIYYESGPWGEIDPEYEYPDND